MTSSSGARPFTRNQQVLVRQRSPVGRRRHRTSGQRSYLGLRTLPGRISLN